MYKQVLRVALSDAHKITVDTKKMLKKLRQDKAISEHEHDQCLGQVRSSNGSTAAIHPLTQFRLPVWMDS